MNGTSQSLGALTSKLTKSIGHIDHCAIAVFPPSVYLGTVGALLEGTHVALGAQNVSEQVSGAFTGEVAAAMLKDVGCQYVIVGHSERRHIYGETDAVVAEKYARAYEEGLTPVVCVGERLSEREAGLTKEVVVRQLDAVIVRAGLDAVAAGVIAYEPVWAIGTGKTAKPEQVQEVHAFIRSRVAADSPEVAEKVRILYGGSVNASNAADLFAMSDVDGGLVGGASLRADEFLRICEAVN